MFAVFCKRSDRQKTPGLRPKGVWDLRLPFVLLTPIAMTMRVLPGGVGLELCPVNRTQAIPEIVKHMWSCIGLNISHG